MDPLGYPPYALIGGPQRAVWDAEFISYELNTLHVVMVIIISIIDYVHPKSAAGRPRHRRLRAHHVRCVTLIGHGKSVFVRTPCGGTLTVYR